MATGEEMIDGQRRKEKALSPINIPASITVPLLPSPPPPDPQIPGTDVTIVERDDQMTQTTTKFDDVSKVFNNCGNFPVDLSDMTIQQI